uniref:G-protein coupled receptors family 1 profile domain-containing protein n=1 Tax=Plectus sambesii TaxID=2011161 RepID=A0A914X8Z2_9BILA
MNITNEDYLVDFYGPSAHWFSIYVAVASVLVIIGNTFFICITLTSDSLRIKSSNWFLLGFATTDLIHGVVHLYDAYAIRFGSIDNRGPCWLAGILVTFTAPISWGFPGLIAADRYYKIIIDYGKFSLGKKLFSELSMELKRILTAPYWLSSIANPWLTVILVQPFRHRILHLLRRVGVIGGGTNKIAAVQVGTTL